MVVELRCYSDHQSLNSSSFGIINAPRNSVLRHVSTARSGVSDTEWQHRWRRTDPGQPRRTGRHWWTLIGQVTILTFNDICRLYHICWLFSTVWILYMHSFSFRSYYKPFGSSDVHLVQFIGHSIIRFWFFSLLIILLICNFLSIWKNLIIDYPLILLQGLLSFHFLLNCLL